MTNFEKSVYRKAYRICKKKSLPFSHSCESFDLTGGFDRSVKHVINDCVYWKNAYEEDFLYIDYD